MIHSGSSLENYGICALLILLLKWFLDFILLNFDEICSILGIVRMLGCIVKWVFWSLTKI